MALGDPYVSVEELKAYLHGGEPTQTQTNRYDDLLQDAIASVTFEINKVTDRQFNRSDDTSRREYEGYRSVRRYRDPVTKGERYEVIVDDFWTTDGFELEVDGTAVTGARLYPLNGVVSGVPGWPFWRIRHESITRSSLIAVTAKWGWAQVPPDIKEACKIQSAQTYRLKNSQFGVAGTSEFGHAMAIRDNSMAMSKINRYRRKAVRIG